MIFTRRSKILYPFRCVPSNGGDDVCLYARNRREAKRLAFSYFYKNYMNVQGIRAYHMPDKPLAIPVKE